MTIPPQGLTETKRVVPVHPLSPCPNKEKSMYDTMAPRGVAELKMARYFLHFPRGREVVMSEVVNANEVGAMKGD